MLTKYRYLALAMVMALVTAIAVVACSPAEPQTIEVTRVVTEQVEVEKPVEVIKKNPVEVVKEVEVEKEVIKEVEVVKEVEVEVIKEVEVMAPEGPKETIVFGDLNWSSALLAEPYRPVHRGKGLRLPDRREVRCDLALVPGPEERRH